MLTVRKKFQLNGHQASIYAISPGLQSNELLSCGSDRQIVCWNMEDKTARLLARTEHSNYSLFLNQSEALLLIGGGDGSISFLDLKQKLEVKNLLHHQSAIFDLAFSPAAQLYIAASADGSISFIDAKQLSCKKIVKLCEGKIRDLAIDESELELAVACGDGTIRIFDLVNLNQKFEQKAHAESANSVCYHPNGIHLLSGGKDAMLCIWERKQSGALLLIEQIPAHNYAIYSIVFHPNANYFATGSRDKTVKIWDAKQFQFQVRLNKENFEGHLNSVNKLCWVKNQHLLLSAGDDRSIMAWEIQD